MPVTKEQWMDWKKNPVTHQFLADVMNSRMEVLEGVADSASGENRDLLLILLGRTQGMKDAVQYAIHSFSYHEEGDPEDDRKGSGISDNR
jgi:hypothetical protein